MDERRNKNKLNWLFSGEMIIIIIIIIITIIINVIIINGK